MSITPGTTVLVRCTIAASAFSGERVVRVPLAPRAHGTYSGVAPVRYCLDGLHQPIAAGWPEAGRVVGGFVTADVVAERYRAGRADLRFPDGETITVPSQAIWFKVVQEQRPRFIPISFARMEASR